MLEKFTNCDISYSNKKINFFGLKEEIADAKVMILKAQVNHYTSLETQLRLSKNVQWRYELKPSEWVDFSLYINSVIESDFSQKKSNVCRLFLKNLNQSLKVVCF